MISRTRLDTILKLALPITLGLASSFIMAFVDIAMVGTLGDQALAAIGLGGVSHMLVLAFMIGATPAVQGIVARRRGESSKEPQCTPLNAGLILVSLIGIPLSLLFYFLSPYYFALISSDPEVTKEGVPYLQALLTALFAAGMSAAFRGFWAGMAKPKVYMLVALFSNCLNIFLNYMFIFGNLGAPKLGTMGAGIASAISIYTAVLIYFVVTYIYYHHEGFLSAKPAIELIKKIFKMLLPISFQEMFFAVGFIIFFQIVGSIGTPELAATTVLSQTTMVMLLFAKALGLTSATLVSNTLGKGDPDGAAAWGWDTGKIGVIWISLLGLPLLVFPAEFLSLFINDSKTLSIAIIPLQLTAISTGVVSLIYILSTTLYSVGDGNKVVLVSSLQWFFFLPSAWIIGPYLNYGLLAVWLVQIIFGLIVTGFVVAIWNSGRWQQVRL